VDQGRSWEGGEGLAARDEPWTEVSLSCLGEGGTDGKLWLGERLIGHAFPCIEGRHSVSSGSVDSVRLFSPSHERLDSRFWSGRPTSPPRGSLPWEMISVSSNNSSRILSICLRRTENPDSRRCIVFGFSPRVLSRAPPLLRRHPHPSARLLSLHSAYHRKEGALVLEAERFFGQHESRRLDRRAGSGQRVESEEDQGEFLSFSRFLQKISSDLPMLIRWCCLGCCFVLRELPSTSSRPSLSSSETRLKG